MKNTEELVIMNFIAVVAVFGLAIWTWLKFFRPASNYRRVQKLPPGPYPFPIVGNILQLGQKPHQTLAKLSKTYGPIMYLQLGRIHTVVISSPEMARAILQKHDQVFSSRTVAAAAQALDNHKYSVAFLPVGDLWRKLRRILREKLVSTQCLDASQGLRRESLLRLSDYVRKCCHDGRAVDIREASFITLLNLVSSTLFSTQVASFDSDETEQFKELVESVGIILGAPNIADYFPILQPFDPQGIKHKFEICLVKLHAFMEDIMNTRLQARGASINYQRKSDLLEILLDLCQEGHNELTHKELAFLCLDIIVAGTDTTASTMEWTLTELLLNPEKLKKVKHELRTVIGQDKQVQESDLPRLPYLQAVIKEVFRYHPPAPLLVPRKSESEIEVNGYVIPKGMQVLINVWAIGREPDVWQNPNSFEPERFLDRNLDFKGQDFELLPFGSGRRICPGLPLANRMLPLLVATLIQNFDWKLEFEAEAEVLRAEMFGLALHKEVPLKAIPMNV